MIKKILIGLVSVVVLIQLVPVDRSNPASDAALEIAAPIEIKAILKKSCYDCHSNEVVWPWYSYVAPVSWLIAHDVEEGREHVNFSEWGTYDNKTQEKAKEEICDEVLEDKMPLPIYLKLHAETALSKTQKQVIKTWALQEVAVTDTTEIVQD